MDLEDPVHPAHVHADRALGRRAPVALERRPAAVRRDRHQVRFRDVHDLHDVRRRRRVHHHRRRRA